MFSDGRPWAFANQRRQVRLLDVGLDNRVNRVNRVR
jgi:hypothetical protein